MNKTIFPATLALLLIVQIFLFTQTTKAAGNDYFAKQTYLIDLQEYSAELQEINYQSPTILKLSDGSYVAVGGSEDSPEYGPSSSDRVFFYTLESGIYKEARLPDNLIASEVFQIDGQLFVFGGDHHLQDGKSVHLGSVYRYIEETNNFVVDSVGAEYGAFLIRYFQIDGHVRRVVMPSNSTRHSEETDGRVETYHPGTGWTATEVPVAKIQLIYQDILQRAADPNGLNYWSFKYSEGMTLTDIEDAFYVSDEYKLSFGNDDIAKLYRNILLREADYDGLSYWTFYYNRGMPLEEIKKHFFESEEYKQLSK